MKIDGKPYRSIWLNENGWSVHIFDQRDLPWKLTIVELKSPADCAVAIKEMWTRGAPLLAMTGAYGLAMALRDDASDAGLDAAYDMLVATRPTAVNLKWALDQVREHVRSLAPEARAAAAYEKVNALCDEDVETNRAIGETGLQIIRDLHAKNPGKPVNILIHCNPGWLATVDFGTATAPIYRAHDEGIPIHVWVDETRPRNQGALLTAYELQQHGVPHTVIVDNAGGLLMQRGQVQMCIVGVDRVTRNGDACNKVGTYLKALAAADNDVPFYVAMPFTTYDPSTPTGRDVPIEERDATEVTHIDGLDENGEMKRVKLTLSPGGNLAFDITPAKYVTAYVTEQGLLSAADLIERAG
ncbi:S-methyl-5-thioribose-1-phosphate isomerase [Ponticaulis koreensis]|uniref:S-methyl-5-thioribose-1-phosphate isomerase n=1 Tax=Ponticaulis koreensis TaxID=1123045 RepID=UPI0003B49603|nr:S-methyl-5-thioribose-1-phosphate isomerase [Ponticaulis koreensis]